MLEILMRLVLNSIIFLELSSDDVVDLGSAVKMMDYTAYELRKLSPEDRTTFLAYARQMAAREHDSRVRDLLLSLDRTMLPNEEDEA